MNNVREVYKQFHEIPPITVTQTAPFQTINLNIDIVVSRELIKHYQSNRKQTLSSKSTDSTNHSQLFTSDPRDRVTR